MVERYVRDVEAAGSNPVTSTSRMIAAQHFRVSLCGARFCFITKISVINSVKISQSWAPDRAVSGFTKVKPVFFYHDHFCGLSPNIHKSKQQDFDKSTLAFAKMLFVFLGLTSHRTTNFKQLHGKSKGDGK